jgi:hypothetical protein
LFGSLRGCPWHVFAAACHCGVKASLQKRTTDDYDFEICWLHVVEWDINGLSWEILGYDYMIIWLYYYKIIWLYDYMIIWWYGYMIICVYIYIHMYICTYIQCIHIHIYIYTQYFYNYLYIHICIIEI